MSKYGINTHLPNNKMLDKCKEANIKWIRCDFNWDLIEPEHEQFNWAITDQVVNNATREGLQIIATIAYSPQWANGGKDRSYPALNTADWIYFVNQVTTRYKASVKHWEIWNEPNLSFFSGTKEDYVQKILKPAANEIRTVDKTLQICGPGLAHQGNRFQDKCWYDWMKYIGKKAGYCFDIVTHHTYSQPTGFYLWRELDGFTLEWYEGKNVYNTIKRYYGKKKMWLTETGYTSNSGEKSQLKNYKNCIKGLDERKWIEMVFFYELVDDPNIKKKWGILRPDLTEKPVYSYIKNIH